VSALTLFVVVAVVVPAPPVLALGPQQEGDRVTSVQPAQEPSSGRLAEARSFDAPGTQTGRLPLNDAVAGTASERAQAAPVMTLERDLVAAGDAYDGFVVVLQDVGPMDHLRSLLTSGRRADALERGRDRVRSAGGVVTGELEGLLTAVIADLTPDEARVLATDPAVGWVSPNTIVDLGARRIVREASHTNGNLILWNLAVADSVATDWTVGLGNARYSDLLDRSYLSSSDGSGVDVFILDTGIDVTRLEFAGRIVPESEYPNGYFSILGDSIDPDDDCNGHGTHVAGTVAGAVSGVAPGARLVPVKVFPECARSTAIANVLDGLSWVSAQVGAVPSRPFVVNMSLGSGVNSTVDAAVEALIGTAASPRVTVVVAAGNSSINVANVSPARVADAITVGALGNLECANQACDSVFFYYDERASYSNFGAGVDIMAPGSATWSTCSTANLLDVVLDGNGQQVAAQRACSDIVIGGVTYPLTPMNGTSMAAPFVAGLAARLLGDRFSADGTVLTPFEVRDALVAGAFEGVLDTSFYGLEGSPNRVANARFLEPEPGGVRLPVVAACSGGSAASRLLPLPASGVGPFLWEVTSGTLPDGLSLSQDGRITGAAVEGTALGSVTLRITDPFGRSASATFTRSDFPPGCPD
jgi:subtilisin family serine protease